MPYAKPYVNSVPLGFGQEKRVGGASCWNKPVKSFLTTQCHYNGLDCISKNIITSRLTCYLKMAPANESHSNPKLYTLGQ